MPSSEGPASNLLGDDPRDGTERRPDELGREAFAIYLAELVGKVIEQSDSSVLALIGDWGSGKSSILELLRRKLGSDGSNWLLAEFNPWTYPDAQHLMRGFFTELLAAVPRADRQKPVRETLGKLAQAVSPWGKLAGAFGVDGEAVLDASADALLGLTSASAAKRTAEEALRDLDHPILMVIDDLDRLTPDELLEVLKLVRLVGRLPHVYYLLAYDERTLLDVLRRTPIAGDDEGRARAYLEKIVQVRLDMPALRGTQRANLMNEGLNSILTANHVALTESDQQRLSDIYSEVLDRRLRTPRSINRFLGQVQASYPPLHGEVDFVDYFLVTWLRTQEPGVYALLHRERDALLGKVLTNWSLNPSREEEAKQKRDWDERLRHAGVGVADNEGVARVLSSLFPKLEAVFSSTRSYGRSSRNAGRRIYDPDYFDRYLNFGVPDEDLPDAVIAAALADLGSRATSTDLQRFTRDLHADPGRLLRKVDAMRISGFAIPEPALFKLLADAWAVVGDAAPRILFSARQDVEHGAAYAIAKMQPVAAAAAVEAVSESAEGAEFAINVVRGMCRSTQSPRTGGYDLTELRAVVSTTMRRLNAVTSGSPFEDPSMQRLRAWQDIDSDAADDWLRTKVDDGTWSLLDTIGALTPVTTIYSGAEPRQGLAEIDLDALDRIFGLTRVFQELSSEIDVATPLPNNPLETEPTPENRSQHALSVLRSARNRDASRETERG
ncbi:MAG: KAP family NTPase [Actinobacteria bacterium]|nr:KAP family NTPase [Actinomycetota bacterium]